MSHLARQQQALLGALFERGSAHAATNVATYLDISWARGQKVYQDNSHALACKALRAAYPVVARLLGDESFDSLAQALWHTCPPRCGDAGRWGDTLGAFVRVDAQLADVPYLADVAHVEWLRHSSASAADVWADPESFALLAEHDPSDLRLLLAPGCATWPSVWPVVSIINAHLQADSAALGQVADLLRAGRSETALVWRAGLRPQLRLTQAGETTFLAALQQGHTLGAAVQASPGLDMAFWLPMAVHTGLLLGVRRASVQTHNGATRLSYMV